MDMRFIDHSTDGLRFTVEFIQLGGVAAGTVQGTPSVFVRTPGADANDTLYMVINRRGRFRIVQETQQFELAVGDAAVFDNRRSSEFHSLEEGQTWSVSLPREALGLLMRDIDRTIERHISGSHAPLRLLTGYLETLFSLSDIAEPELAGMHIIDLVVSALADRDAPDFVDESNVRAARLRALLNAIAQDFGNAEIDASQMAKRQGYSVRYLHRLLEETGKTFSEHVVARRLERAHRLLRDPRLVGRKIGDIAFDAGFQDLSHFNRSFRRQFGMTPSEVRTQAALPENDPPIDGGEE